MYPSRQTAVRKGGGGGDGGGDMGGGDGGGGGGGGAGMDGDVNNHRSGARTASTAAAVPAASKTWKGADVMAFLNGRAAPDFQAWAEKKQKQQAEVATAKPTMPLQLVSAPPGSMMAQLVDSEVEKEKQRGKRRLAQAERRKHQKRQRESSGSSTTATATTTTAASSNGLPHASTPVAATASSTALTTSSPPRNQRGDADGDVSQRAAAAAAAASRALLSAVSTQSPPATAATADAAAAGAAADNGHAPLNTSDNEDEWEALRHEDPALVRWTYAECKHHLMRYDERHFRFQWNVGNRQLCELVELGVAPVLHQERFDCMIRDKEEAERRYGVPTAVPSLFSFYVSASEADKKAKVLTLYQFTSKSALVAFAHRHQTQHPLAQPTPSRASSLSGLATSLRPATPGALPSGSPSAAAAASATTNPSSSSSARSPATAALQVATTLTPMVSVRSEPSTPSLSSHRTDSSAL